MVELPTIRKKEWTAGTSLSEEVLTLLKKSFKKSSGVFPNSFFMMPFLDLPYRQTYVLRGTQLKSVPQRLILR